MAQMKQRNIGTGLHYRAVHLYPYYRDHFGFKPGDFRTPRKSGSAS